MSKIKTIIMKTKPPVTDLEMEGYKDFNAVLSAYRQHKPVSGSSGLTRKILWITGSTLVITSLLVWYTITKDQEPVQQDAPTELPQHSEPNLPELSPVTLPTGEDSVDTVQKLPIPSPKTESAKTEKVAEPMKASDNKSGKSDAVETTSFIPAIPIDGYDALYQFLNAQLAYPKEGIKDSIQGVTTVSFIINKEGRAERINVEQSLGPAFDREAIRVIEQMPRWTPALMNGEPVPSKLSLPLTFQLKKF
jgi:TonB family protein